jgi:hypothetical protein
VTDYPDAELLACGDQLSGWTCTLLAGPHPERKHWDQQAGRWWPQTSDAPHPIGAILGTQPERSQS